MDVEQVLLNRLLELEEEKRKTYENMLTKTVPHLPEQLRKEAEAALSAGYWSWHERQKRSSGG